MRRRPTMIMDICISSFVLSVLFMFQSTHGLICFTCNNEKSFDMCTRMGSLAYCQPNEKSCHTEVLRFLRPEGVVYSVSKRCKQDDACKNNEVQNPKAAWAPTQCNPRFPNSVCRCCCKGDLCNRGGLYCPLGPMCRPIPQIEKNGYTKCDLGRNRFSRCTHECLEGYMLIGPDTTECVSRGIRSLRWTNNTIPRCVRSSCLTEMTRIRNGYAKCSDGNNIGSQCEFTCREGYMLQLGWPMVTCHQEDEDEDPTWDGDVPVCGKISCQPYEEPPVGSLTCSNGEEIDSVCGLKCDETKGYYLIGRNETKCGVWYNTLPPRWKDDLGVCKKVVCSPLVPPKHGSVKCTKSFEYQSQCRFSCDPGYVPVGGQFLKCFNFVKTTGVGKWNKRAPTCTPRKCFPKLKVPTRGQMSCTSGFLYGSQCSLTCDQGYFVAGPKSVTCNKVLRKGRVGWSDKPPRCQPRRCTGIDLPSSATMSCTKGFRYMSVCKITCGDGFDVVGESELQCSTIGDDGSALWDKPVPTCTAKRCFPALEDPKNGKVRCTRGNRFGSRCTFSCLPGYFRKGSRQRDCADSTALSGGSGWTNTSPTCEAISCPPIKSPSNGKMLCTNGGKYGSNCKFTCDRNHDLEGKDLTSCRDVNNDGIGEWSSKPPTCTVSVCDNIARPDNGLIACTRGRNQGSRCEFNCNTGFVRTGPRVVFCQALKKTIPKWTDQPPTCEILKCPTLLPPTNGKVSCDKGREYSSKCSFTCEDEYEMYPQERDTTTCLSSGNWSNPGPCCFAYCPPTAVMDMVIVLDSSSSITAKNWVKVINFVKSLIRSFTVSPKFTKFGFFRYNAVVDQVNEAYLNSYRNHDDLERALDKLPYNGEGTNTGAALTHALSKSLHPSHGNRPNAPDVILLITDGVSTSGEIETAVKLVQKSDTKIIALFIKPALSALTNKALGQLKYITGDEKNVVQSARGFDYLSDALITISEAACRRECTGTEVTVMNKEKARTSGYRSG